MSDTIINNYDGKYVNKNILIGVVVLLSGCQGGSTAIKQVQSPGSPTAQASILVAWDVEHVSNVKKAEFDFSAQFCENTVRGGGVTVKAPVKTLLVSKIDGQDVDNETARWMSVGEHVIDYKVLNENSVVEKQGQVKFALSKGRQYFLQSQFYDFDQVKMESCQGSYYRLQDNEGLTDYPVCDNQVSLK